MRIVLQVIIISSCQDKRGLEEDDWDELIAAGSIQLMLNDTEMILRSQAVHHGVTGTSEI